MKVIEGQTSKEWISGGLNTPGGWFELASLEQQKYLT